MGLLDAFTGAPAKKAAAANQAYLTQAQDRIGGQIADATARGASAIQDGRSAAQSYYDQAHPAALTALADGYGEARNAYNGAYNAARTDLTNGAAQGRTDLQTGLNQQFGLIGRGRDAALSEVDRGYRAANGYLDTAARGYDPYVQAGGAATQLYSDSLGLNGADGNARAVSAFQAGPGYTWAVDQATDAAARKAASLGLAASGNTLDAITRLSQNLANQEYGGWQTRLSGLSGQGLQATGAQAGVREQQANLASTTGTQRAGIVTDAAGRQASAAGTTAAGMANIATTSGQQLAGLAQAYGTQMGGSYTQEGAARAALEDSYGRNSADLAYKAGTSLGSLYENEGRSLGTVGQNLASAFTKQNSDAAAAEAAASGNIWSGLLGVGSLLTKPVTGSLDRTVAGSLFNLVK